MWVVALQEPLDVCCASTDIVVVGADRDKGWLLRWNFDRLIVHVGFDRFYGWRWRRVFLVLTVMMSIDADTVDRSLIIDRYTELAFYADVEVFNGDIEVDSDCCNADVDVDVERWYYYYY